MSTAGNYSRQTRQPYRWWVLFAVLGLAIPIAALHGRALQYGLFMDDYAHYRQLRDCGWSLGELVRACHLELTGGIIELWWMPECTLRFFRPVAFGLMKLTYALNGWSPLAMHVASLAWHLAACTLLMLLIRRLGAPRRLAWVVAGLFAIHPAHVATVQWIASQTELIVTTLLLAALLCWAEFRRWPNGSVDTEPDRRPRQRWGWGLACAVLFTGALGCRENAIVFPFVVLAVEPLMRRRRSRATLVLFATFGIAIATYLALRTHYLGGAALPPRPYVVPPTDPDFFRYILDKACYYLLGEFLLVPCVPIGGLAYFRERPLVFYGFALLVAVVLAVLVVRNRRTAVGILAPACLLGFMVPVLPTFESPHHLYLPGIGWALFATLLLQEIGGFTSARKAGSERRRAVARIVAIGSALIFGVSTHFYGIALDTAQAVEDRVVEEIAASPQPVTDGDTLYIANLPVIAHYVRLAVEERTGVRDLQVVALTWSPRLLGVATPSELTWVDERTIEVRVSGDRYFSGPLRLLIEQAAGGQSPLALHQPLRYKSFIVEPLAGDSEGISTLRFTFDRPLAQTGVHLFWGSRTRWAYQVSP
ncbi:MAG: hypothetical protein KKI02_09470 [Planctomycetes bacterium]|nr:hypothetical protein [Planctomycetota bacterium]